MGVHVSDIDLRPLRGRTTWCLSATAGITTAARVSELAHLCGITVCGRARHWRRHELASRLRMFLEMREGAPSFWYKERCFVEAQKWLDGAARRNEDQFASQIGVHHHEHSQVMTEADMTALQKLLPKKLTQLGPTCNPPATSFSDTSLWSKVMDHFAMLSVRKQLLSTVLNSITRGAATASSTTSSMSSSSTKSSTKSKAASTGIFVVAPEGKPYDMALAYLLKSRDDVTTDPKEYKQDKGKNILLLATENAAGLNLQGRGNHIVLFMPLFGDVQGRGAADREAQAIGRIHRNGQEAHEVHVHHVLVHGPNDELTIDHSIQRRNLAIRAQDEEQRLNVAVGMKDGTVGVDGQ